MAVHIRQRQGGGGFGGFGREDGHVGGIAPGLAHPAAEGRADPRQHEGADQQVRAEGFADGHLPLGEAGGIAVVLGQWSAREAGSVEARVQQEGRPVAG
jgi:hypothetical protein